MNSYAVARPAGWAFNSVASDGQTHRAQRDRRKTAIRERLGGSAGTKPLIWSRDPRSPGPTSLAHGEGQTRGTSTSSRRQNFKETLEHRKLTVSQRCIWPMLAAREAPAPTGARVLITNKMAKVEDWLAAVTR